MIFQKFGVSEYEVEAAILNGDPMDQLVIAYSLIMDNKRIIDNSKLVIVLFTISSPGLSLFLGF